MNRSFFWCLTFSAMAISASLFAGCTPSASSAKNTSTVATIDEIDLHQRVRSMVLHSRDGRPLNSEDHNAWQVVHGMLAYGRTFPIIVNGKSEPALDWVLNGGNLKGWGLKPADHGVASTIIEGKLGAGHPDQWLGYLSQSGLKIDDKVVVEGKTYTVKDMLEQTKFDLFENKESPWALMATSTYMPIDATWKARDGQTWSTEKILEMEAKRPLAGGACGATHKLYAISVAVNCYLNEKQIKPEQLTGAWKLGNDRVQEAIKLAREYQNPDGSFSDAFFQRAGYTDNIAQRIYSTGHTLEFLIAAMSKEQTREPWVARGALALTKMLEQRKKQDVECGALYHAAHGLLLYSERRFNDPIFDLAAPPAETPSTQPPAKPAAAPTAKDADPAPAKDADAAPAKN